MNSTQRLYGAWITPKGNLINVTEYDGHFTYAVQYLYPNQKNISAEQANKFYSDMFEHGFLRLTYTKTGYTIEKGQNQKVKNSQLSYIENAEAVNSYMYR